jgi:hypothetical protein
VEQHPQSIMKTNILLCAVVSVLTIGFADEPNDLTKLPTVTLSDGNKLTLLGVTYGKNHVAPHFEEIGGNLRTGNWITRPNVTTVVWIEIEHDPAHWPSYSLLVSDKANTACVQAETTCRSHAKTGVEVQGFLLSAFPRWEKEIVLRIADPYGKDLGKDPWVISNPDFRIFGHESATPLPDTQSDGDVQVTLRRLIAGAPLPPTYRHNNVSPDDPQNKCVRIVLISNRTGSSSRIGARGT